MCAMSFTWHFYKLIMRYFIYLSFDGTHYHGWQVQPNANSVEAEIEKALSTLLRKDIEIVGAGRTDTGVHARQMVAHFDFSDDFSTQQLTYKLNRILPSSIVINAIKHVSDDLHARFSAKWRTYHYYIHMSKNPFADAYSLELHYELDIQLMNEAASHLLNCSDFAAFCKSNTDVATTLCNVTEARWINDGEDKWHFVITANRFLRNMVRAIVGTLIDVGRRKITIKDFDNIVTGKNRSAAGESMPAKGLFLEKIVY